MALEGQQKRRAQVGRGAKAHGQAAASIKDLQVMQGTRPPLRPYLAPAPPRAPLGRQVPRAPLGPQVPRAPLQEENPHETLRACRVGRSQAGLHPGSVALPTLLPELRRVTRAVATKHHPWGSTGWSVIVPCPAPLLLYPPPLRHFPCPRPSPDAAPCASAGGAHEAGPPQEP